MASAALPADVARTEGLRAAEGGRRCGGHGIGLVLPGPPACDDLVDAVLVGQARLVSTLARQKPGERVGLVRVARRIGSTTAVEQLLSRDGVHGAFRSLQRTPGGEALFALCVAGPRQSATGRHVIVGNYVAADAHLAVPC